MAIVITATRNRIRHMMQSVEMDMDQAYRLIASNLDKIGEHALEFLRSRIEVEQRERDAKIWQTIERNLIMDKLLDTADSR